jgi:hypothetical protein
VGIDAERVEARSAAFAEMAFTPAERERLQEAARALQLDGGAALTLGWCAKEAALKLLGAGLRAPLQEVEVLLGPPEGEIALPGAADGEDSLRRVRVRLRCSAGFAAELGTQPERELAGAVGRDGDALYMVIWE